MAWNNVIEYRSMTDRAFACETGLSKDKVEVEKAEKRWCLSCQDKNNCTAFLPLGECCLNKEKRKVRYDSIQVHELRGV